MYIFCILVLLIFNTLGITSIAEVIIDGEIYGTGCLPISEEVINAHLDRSPVMYSALPNAVDNTDIFPPPGNQGQQGSCSAWAVGYALKSGQEIKNRGWSRTATSHLFSPAYIFNQIPNNEDGIGIDMALDVVCITGICSLNYFPYNENDGSTQPGEIQMAAARLYKTSNWKVIQGINKIKSYIAQGEGVVIGIMVNNDFNYLNSANSIYDNKYPITENYHAICLIGYDNSKNAFKFINSWGTGWQLGGYGWISYDLVNDSDVNLNGAGIGYVLEYSQYDDYVLGDVTGDSNVTAADARLILRFSSKLETPTSMQAALADVNGDAQVTAADAQATLRYSSNLIEKLPLYE